MTIAPTTFTPLPRIAKSEEPSHSNTLLDAFLLLQSELESYKSGIPVKVDGQTLSIPAIVAAARYGASSRKVIQAKLEAGHSVYGLSTGFGGSADTRTNDPLALGKSLLQHQHSGVLPIPEEPMNVLPLTDPIAGFSMPESWVRAAILIRMNSLIRGHSGVRWEFIEALGALLRENIIPVVPLRGSISSSGDLSPLSYVAGTLIGNQGIRVFDGPSCTMGPRKIVPATEAYKDHGLEHIQFEGKEHLGLLNGTAFSAAVASLVLSDAANVAVLAQVCTAMGTEALLGSQGTSLTCSFHPRRRTAHPGQVELSFEEDVGKLRQDRYPLRTAPQFLGPQIEDILSAITTLTQESNSTTDNPLVDSETGHVHHGGNFQAMSVTNPMEHVRVALHHIGKLLFAQLTELINPSMNRGLPPNLSATDPSINYFGKGLDIAGAAYVSELGYLANPVSTHIQSAEMHNQAVNSLALISARQTVQSLEIVSMLIASYLYAICQAVDLRALQHEFSVSLARILTEEISIHLTPYAKLRMETVAAATTVPLMTFLSQDASLLREGVNAVELILASQGFRMSFAARSVELLQSLRGEYLSGARGPVPAAPFLGRTRPLYVYIREKLGVPMHGWENYNSFADGFGDVTVGGNATKIYEAIRDGELQKVIVDIFRDI
ncbi:phenylalanine ammonia-lyase [Cantharellus anzutake]|uniref:phenylalanine ammonia-lyase n=1 Tax=Cantharellus anzutake TaxID=1750568 RepID=UPI0019044D84|nr:phenylalanine ammonia-lyase [Cantharellus anzutake]KAF8342677.1 phenylalanine ammonia-lyase [Cantharellus anzutake]